MSARQDGSPSRLFSVPRSVRFAVLAAPAALSVSPLGLPQATAAPAEPSSLAQPAAAASTSPEIEAGQQAVQVTQARPSRQQRLAAFARAGYDYDDAEVLARYWNGDMTPFDAKLAAGGKLLAGDPKAPVPIEPDQSPWDVDGDVARVAYFNNGYGYTEAVKLAELWEITGPESLSEVKATAGRKIMAGVSPFGEDPEFSNDELIAAEAFLDAGYDYADAERLARIWEIEDDVWSAKVIAGNKILAGLEVPLD